MLKIEDMAKKPFILSAILLTFIILITTSGVYAVDDNQTVVSELQADTEDNIEVEQLNSQNLEVEDSEVGSFSEIQNAVFDANDGDTIVLDKEKYVGDGKEIYINNSISIQGKTGSPVILDAQGKSNIFIVQDNANNIKISNIMFINGNASLSAGAIYVQGENVTIEDCIFSDNKAKGGGAIYTSYDNAAANLKIINCEFNNNSALIAGGALGVYGNNSQIINCTFNSNRVYGSDEKNNEVYGGAIQMGMDNLNIVGKCENCTFISNSAFSSNPNGKSHGGAGCVRDGIDYINCKFISNSADQGGALTYHSSGNIINCTFENNTAVSLYGGALSTGYNVTDMDLIIENSQFKGNTAPTGGAAYLIGENVTIKNCNFDGNNASSNGGAVYIDAKSTTIQKSVLNNNIANVNGGGVYINSDKSIITGNTFTYNQAIPDASKLDDGLGGAIFVNSSDSLIENNNFDYNVARNGSAIYIGNSATKSTINNNEMFENQAWVYRLPIEAPLNPVLYGETVTVTSTIHGGNNIGNISNLAVSNAIFNSASRDTITIDGTTPVSGATDSGELYQDDREYNILISLKIEHEDGTVVYENTLASDVFGEIEVTLDDLKPGKYYVSAKHLEDTYYKAIENTTTFTVLPKVDVAISKNSSFERYNYGDIVRWDLKIENNGPNNATGVIVNDDLPEGLIYINDTSYGKYNFKTGIWNVGNLDVGESASISIFTKVNRTGEIDNQANVTSNEYDYDLTNNYDYEIINVNPAADLEVIKTVSNKTPNFNDVVVWTITIANNGPDVANEVKVYDKLESGLIYLSNTEGVNYNPLTGLWNVGSLKVNEKRTINITCIVNKTGKLVNDVNISGKEFDWNLNNNNASEFIEVPESADVAIEKYVNNSNPNYLDLITWTIKVTNNGPDNATGVLVYEILPEGLIYLSDDGEGLFNGSVWNIGNLQINQTKLLNIVCKVNKTGTFTNFVSVKANEYDFNKTNNHDNESVDAPKSADLEVLKEVSNKNPNYGEVIFWTIKVVNNGPDMATNVKVSDVLPDGLVYIRNTISRGSYDEKSGIWSINSIASGSSEFLQIYCLVNKTGQFENFVSVTGDEYDYNKTNNYDEEDVFVNKTIDLAIEKSVNNTNPNYKQLVKWTISITNNGPDNATGVVVCDIIPDGLAIISSALNNGIWNVGTLNVGEKKQIDIICLVNKTGEFINKANVSGNEFDLDLANNNGSSKINVAPAVDLSITKTSSKIEYSVGEVIDYVVVVRNNGPDRATSVKVQDYLDSNLMLTSFTADKGSFSQDGTQWFIDSLESGSSAKLTFKALAKSSGSFENKVSVESNEYDYDLSNNNDSVVVKIKDVLNNTSFKSFVYNLVPMLKMVEVQDNIKNIEKAMDIENIVKGLVSMKETGVPIWSLAIALLMLVSWSTGLLRRKK